MREKELYSYLKAIGADNLDIKDFNDRLKLQKYIYLLQEFRVDLGFRFRYYIRGPYSPDLADAGYRLDYMKKEGLLDSEPVKVMVDNGDRVEEFKRFICGYRDNPKMLELLATIHFLSNYSYNPQPKTQKDIKKFIQDSETKPNFTDDEYREAFIKLRKSGLVVL